MNKLDMTLSRTIIDETDEILVATSSNKSVWLRYIGVDQLQNILSSINPIHSDLHGIFPFRQSTPSLTSLSIFCL